MIDTTEYRMAEILRRRARQVGARPEQESTQCEYPARTPISEESSMSLSTNHASPLPPVVKPRTGITFDPSSGQWTARIMSNGRLRFLGMFPSRDLADESYEQARRDQIESQSARTAKGEAEAVKTEGLPKGVRFDPKTRKYLARIMRDGVRQEIGYFSSADEAGGAYQKARERAYSARGKPKAKPGPKPKGKPASPTARRPESVKASDCGAMEVQPPTPLKSATIADSAHKPSGHPCSPLASIVREGDTLSGKFMPSG